MDDAKPMVTALRLRHPDLVFHVDVTLTEKNGRWLAVAVLGPRVGHRHSGRSLGRRCGAALAAMGVPIASELARDAELPA